MIGQDGTIRWLGLAVVGVTVLSVLLSGCGSSPKDETSTSRSEPAATPTTNASASAGPVYEVRVGSVNGLGKVLVDGQNMTLYLFAPDKQSGRSTCYKACSEAWPPLLLPAGTKKPIFGPGVQSSLLGTTRRGDGTTQVTYDKWPLYLWVGDTQPGQATGQDLNNLGGLWFVLAPSGREITSRS